MNILVTSRELDMVGYHMLEQLSYRQSMTIYIAVSTKEEHNSVRGNCIPLTIPVLKSKLVWDAIKAIRKIIKEKKIDIVFLPVVRLIQQFVRIYRH